MLEVLSLTDGLSKMSNSDPSDQSQRNLLDPKDVHYEEIMSIQLMDKVLVDGFRKTADIADATLKKVYQAVGFSCR